MHGGGRYVLVDTACAQSASRILFEVELRPGLWPTHCHSCPVVGLFVSSWMSLARVLPSCVLSMFHLSAYTHLNVHRTKPRSPARSSKPHAKLRPSRTSSSSPSRAATTPRETRNLASASSSTSRRSPCSPWPRASPIPIPPTSVTACASSARGSTPRTCCCTRSRRRVSRGCASQSATGTSPRRSRWESRSSRHSSSCPRGRTGWRAT